MIDLDRVSALDRDRVELFVFDAQINALIDLVAASLVCGFDGLARPFVDQLLAKAVARFLVDLSEGDPLGRGCRSVQGDRARDEGELEINPSNTGATGAWELLLNAVENVL